MSLHLQLCQNHSDREAVARCPVCRSFFCRECITEHDDKVICAACLAKSVRQTTNVRKPFRSVLRIAAFVSGLFFAGISFYGFGQLLLKIPTSVHEGSGWSSLISP